MSVGSTKVKFVTGPMRLPFLLLPPVCVLLGIATAYREAASINWIWAMLALIGALAAHVSVNALNEYVDCRSGLDMKTQRTPFSGGSGVLPQRPGLAYVALATGLVSLATVIVIAAYFALWRAAELLPIVAVGVVLVVLYTPVLTRRPLLCLIAPGLGFALMTLGTHVVLAGEYSWLAVTASLVPFFLVSDLLLLNQFPDRVADASVGRRHLLVVLGAKKSSLVYGAFLAGTYLTVVGGVLAGIFPIWCLLGLATAPLALVAARGAYRYGEEIPRLLPYLGMNVVLNLVTPILVAIGLFVGGR